MNGFCRDDLRVIRLFADQAALAIEHAQLHERQEHMAVLEERQRLARELHDSVTQSLYGATMYTEAAARLLKAGDIARAAETLGEARETALEALREMRLLIFELRPSSLEEEGLIAALQARISAVETRVGVRTEFEADEIGRLPARVEVGLYRIAQEALNNALQHSMAGRITVRMRSEADCVILEVSDDGRGFDRASRTGRGGLGLQGMKERAEEMGGVLCVRSRPGEGTAVKVEVPVSWDGT
jgi:signal transduction histidine kinase